MRPREIRIAPISGMVLHHATGAAGPWSTATLPRSWGSVPDDRLEVDETPVHPVPLSGWDKRTYRLGDELSVRLPSAAQVEKELGWPPPLGTLEGPHDRRDRV